MLLSGLYFASQMGANATAIVLMFNCILATQGYRILAANKGNVKPIKQNYSKPIKCKV